MNTDPHQVAQVMNLAYQGDPTAKSEFFALIYDKLVERVRRARSKHPGARCEARTTDDVHEVWLRMVEKKIGDPSKLRGRDHFCAACYICACNLMRDRLKRKERQLMVDAPDTEPAQDRRRGRPSGPSTAADRHLALDDIGNALSWLHEQGELSDLDVTLYGHVYVTGLQQTKAFRQLGIKESSGRDMLNRVHAKIGAFLRRRGTGGSHADG